MAIDSEAKRWSMLALAGGGPAVRSFVFNPDTSGLVSVEKITILRHYGGNAWSAPSLQPDITTGVEFDGSTDWLFRDDDLVGAGDSKAATWSFWIKTTATSAVIFDAFKFIQTTARVEINATGNIEVTGRDSSYNDIISATSSSAVNDGQWHHVFISFHTHFEYEVETFETRFHLYIDGADALTPSPTISNAEIGFIAFTDYGIGATGEGDSLYTGCMLEFWFNTEYKEVNSGADVAGWYADNAPVSLGSDGSTPTGNTPLIYLSGGADQFASNLGSGGAFVDQGSLIDCVFVAPEVEAPRRAGGRSRGGVCKYPRRVYIEGKLYWVRSPEEERRLLADYLESLERRAEELEFTGAAKTTVAKAKVKVVRAARRLEKVEDRAEQWNEYLCQEDEEILMMVM